MPQKTSRTYKLSSKRNSQTESLKNKPFNLCTSYPLQREHPHLKQIKQALITKISKSLQQRTQELHNSKEKTIKTKIPKSLHQRKQEIHNSKEKNIKTNSKITAPKSTRISPHQKTRSSRQTHFQSKIKSRARDKLHFFLKKKGLLFC